MVEYGLGMARAETGQGRAAYVVLSHNHPQQVTRLVRAVRLSSPNADIVIYHDARRTKPPPSQGPWMYVLCHRRRADWGSWDLAASSIDALSLARRLTKARVFVLISGQDYPAVRLEDWEREFLRRGGWQGEAHLLRYRTRWGRVQGVGDDDMTRYSHLWWPLPWADRLSRGSGWLASSTRSMLYRVGHYAEPVIDIRNLPRGRGMHVGIRNPVSPFRGGLHCAKGSQWLALEAPLLDMVLRMHREKPWFRWSYQHSVIPDESYLQTMLSAVCRPQEAPPVTYLEWSVEKDRPKTLQIDDLTSVTKSGSPFCRKVEPQVSDRLMDELDRLTGSPQLR